MEQVGLAISPDVLHNELEMSRAVLDKWTKLVGNGIPGIDHQAPPQEVEKFLRELVGELRLVAGNCDTLAEIVGTAIV